MPRVCLCLDSLRDSLSVGILCTGGGVPIVALAIDFTAFVALNFFFFFRIALIAPPDSVTLALCNNRLLPDTPEG